MGINARKAFDLQQMTSDCCDRGVSYLQTCCACGEHCGYYCYGCEEVIWEYEGSHDCLGKTVIPPAGAKPLEMEDGDLDCWDKK
jgi:hypothetical protein